MQFNGQYTVATTDTVKGKLEYGINNYLSMLFRSLTNVCVPQSFAFASKEHKGFAREDANASLWNAKVFEREHKTFARVRST